MKRKPFISIITPTLNDKKNLKNLIINLKRQSFKNFEHIVADGGSTDGTIDYLKSTKLPIFEKGWPVNHIKIFNENIQKNPIKLSRSSKQGFLSKQK